MAPRRKDEADPVAGITGTGTRKCAWFHEDEAEALSMAQDAIRLVLEDCNMQPNGCCAILKQ